MSPSKLSISIAMATYNGARFVRAQLASVAAQTRLPDEIVVGDDQSSDETLAIVAEFAKETGIRVRAQCNVERLGTTNNFEEVVSRCEGDIIVFSDQDDVWRRDKLEKIEDAFQANPDSPYVFCDAALMDENGAPLPGTLWEKAQFFEKERALYRAGRGFEVLLRHNPVWGATLAVRRAAIGLALPFEKGAVPRKFEKGVWVHDYWIVSVLEALGRGVLLEEPLMSYRLHSAQETGVPRFSTASMLAMLSARDENYYASEVMVLRRLLARIEGRAQCSEYLTLLQKKLAFSERRRRMRSEPWYALPRILGSWGTGDYRLYTLNLLVKRTEIPLAIPLDVACSVRSLFAHRP